MLNQITLALTLLCCVCSSAHANIDEWTGLYRGVCLVEQTDGKRHEVQCTLEITEGVKGVTEVLAVQYGENSTSIQILNLGSAPEHLTVELTDKALGIAPLFAHPISIKLQKESGGFNETLITGDLIEYNVSYAQKPKVIKTLHLKLGKLK